MSTSKRIRGDTVNYETLQRKLRIEQHELHLKRGVTLDAPGI